MHLDVTPGDQMALPHDTVGGVIIASMGIFFLIFALLLVISEYVPEKFQKKLSPLIFVSIVLTVVLFVIIIVRFAIEPDDIDLLQQKAGPDADVITVDHKDAVVIHGNVLTLEETGNRDIRTIAQVGKVAASAPESPHDKPECNRDLSHIDEAVLEQLKFQIPDLKWGTTEYGCITDIWTISSDGTLTRYTPTQSENHTIYLIDQSASGDDQ